MSRGDFYDPRLGVPYQSTEEALEQIAPGRAPQPAAALKQLAVAVIKAVAEVDQATGVSNYLERLTIHCKSTGEFELEIVDRDSELAAQDLADAVAAELDEQGNFGYHKPLRPIDIRDPEG